jgi:hypothetical protein
VATNRAVSVTTSRLARLPDLEYTSRSRHSGTEMSCADAMTLGGENRHPISR